MKKIPYTKEKLQEVCANSTSYRQVLLAFERNPNGGGAYSTLKKKIAEYGIDISHFLGQASNQGACHRGGSKEKYSLDEVFCENSPVTQRVLRSYVERHNIMPYICAFCGNDGHWQQGFISLELDHIDGNNTNNQFSNLRYLCPNCHALTETYCGKNKKKA